MWLEDDLSSDAHSNRRELVGDILQEKGYESIICEFETFSKAKSELESVKRYDFFISDFNLEDSETGLNYLEEIRRINGYKQFVILYSNNEYSTIKADVINVLQEKNLDIFSNFTFFSVGDHLEEYNFKKAIDVILCRWDELNAIRGRYMCENAELEHLLREKLNEFNEDIPYRKLFEIFFREKVRLQRPNLTPANKIKYTKLKSEWSDLIDKRNALAHVEEGFEKGSGYYIQSSKNADLKIQESDLDHERKYLVNLKKEIMDFLNKKYY
ncbi:hypothetical protein [Streptococcus anginosus]|uniref:hypothetical protein n=1 Tax=Streptococcus anginosus TaxID=1328 RepID=UPI001CBD62CD|nr:hypothetical protein [Streptococcus anginosus]